MSKLEELIQQLCPDGVEYKRLNTACEIFDGTHSTPDYKSEGVKFVSVENINNLYETKKYISFEDYSKYKVKPQVDDILMTRIGSIGVCTVIDRNEPLAYYVSLALLRPDTMVFNSKYLKYAIESLHGRKELRKRTLVNAVPIKVNKDDIGKITIPTPPMEVQREIVRILDQFTELTAELNTQLTAELTARKEQYEYYRDELLTFGSDVPMKALGDVCNVIAGGTPSKKNNDYWNDGTIRWLSSTVCKNQKTVNEITGYITEKGVFESSSKIMGKETTLVALVGATIGKVAFLPFEAAINQNIAGIYPKNVETLLPSYVYYACTTLYPKFLALTQGTKLAMANMSFVRALQIPLPPIEKQHRIVSILDRFDALCNDLISGLPAEIEARRKQYEYYRDKLLAFKEKS